MVPQLFACDFLGFPNYLLVISYGSPALFACDFLWFPQLFACDFLWFPSYLLMISYGFLNALSHPGSRIPSSFHNDPGNEPGNEPYFAP